MLLVSAILRVYKLSIHTFDRNDTNQNAQGTKKKARKVIYLCSIYVNAIKNLCALPGLRQISELPHQL